MSKDARSRKISARLNQEIWQVFDGLNQGFGGVANTIKKLVSSLPGLSVAVHSVQTSSCSRQWLTNNTSADGVTAPWVNEAANKVFGQLYNQVPSKPIAPDASKAPLRIELWAHGGTAGYTRHGHSG